MLKNSKLILKLFVVYSFFINTSLSNDIISIEVSSESNIYVGGNSCYIKSNGDFGYLNMVYKSDGSIVKILYLMESYTDDRWDKVLELLPNKIEQLDKINIKKETAPAGATVLTLKITFKNGKTKTYKSFNNKHVLSVCLYLSKEGWENARCYLPVILDTEKIKSLSQYKYPRDKRK